MKKLEKYFNNKKATNYFLFSLRSNEWEKNRTFLIPSHISFAVTLTSWESPDIRKQGHSET